MKMETGNEIQAKTDLLNDLVHLAIDEGADGAVAIPAAAIVVVPGLADLCHDPKCENYGLSASCPPYVSGPQMMQRLLPRFEHAIFFKIDVPTDILLSNERRHVFKILHTIASLLERTAVKRGFSDAMALAGGSCKEIFCMDQPNCQVVEQGSPCRHQAPRCCQIFHVRIRNQCLPVNGGCRVENGSSHTKYHSR